MTDLTMAELTPNQKRALNYMPQGKWFFPDDAGELVYIHNRFNTCRILADRDILLRRPVDRGGTLDFEFMLPYETAKKLGICKETP